MGTIRRFDIKAIIESYNISTFLETGTLYGDGVEAALEAGFKEIISIEIDHELAVAAKKKFENISNVTIIEGNSFEVLMNIISNLNGNCLFWLDAHFPGADAHKKPYDYEQNIDIRLPFKKEFDIILENRKQFQDVIVADDLWLYEDEDLCEIGKFDDHMKKCGFEVSRSQILPDNNLDFLRKKILGKYELTKFYNDQGYIVLTPI